MTTMTPERAAEIRRQAAPAIAMALEWLAEFVYAQHEPDAPTPTRRAGRSPRTGNHALPVAQEAGS